MPLKQTLATALNQTFRKEYEEIAQKYPVIEIFPPAVLQLFFLAGAEAGAKEITKEILHG